MPQGFVVPQVDPASISIPQSGTASIVVDLSGIINVITNSGGLAVVTPVNPVNQTSDQVVGSSSSGNTNIGPGSGVHVVVVNVSGAPGTRQFSLLKSMLGPVNQGFRMKVVFNCPSAAAGIVLQTFDANTAGQLLFNWTTDGINQSAVADHHFTGSQWVLDDAKVPATV